MISSEQEKADMLAYIDELGKNRLPKFSERAAAIPTGLPGSSEWLKEVGDYWKEVREDRGMTRYEVASVTGTHVNVIRFLEEGLAYTEELTGDLLPKLSQALSDNMAPLESFRERYNISQMMVKIPRFKRLPFIASRWIPMNETA